MEFELASGIFFDQLTIDDIHKWINVYEVKLKKRFHKNIPESIQWILLYQFEHKYTEKTVFTIIKHMLRNKLWKHFSLTESTRSYWFGLRYEYHIKISCIKYGNFVDFSFNSPSIYGKFLGMTTHLNQNGQRVLQFVKDEK